MMAAAIGFKAVVQIWMTLTLFLLTLPQNYNSVRKRKIKDAFFSSFFSLKTKQNALSNQLQN